MNFIETLRSVVESAESSYNERDRKIDIYCESVNDQLAIDLKKAELFVMKESGTDEDLAYLEDGAIAEAGERLVEAIKAIIENIKRSHIFFDKTSYFSIFIINICKIIFF